MDGRMDGWMFSWMTEGHRGRAKKRGRGLSISSTQLTSATRPALYGARDISEIPPIAAAS